MIFVPGDAIAAAAPAAEARHEQALAERAAAVAAEQQAEADQVGKAEARHAELEALDPPAVAVIDGLAWAQAEDGSYAPVDEDEDGFVPSWLSLVANFDADNFGDTFATREAFDAAMSAALETEQAT